MLELVNRRYRGKSKKRPYSKIPRVTIHAALGYVLFGKAAAELYGIRKGSRVGFDQDVNREGEWYLVLGGEFTVGSRGPQPSVSNYVQCRALVDDILESVGMAGVSIRVPLGQPWQMDGLTLIPLLTREIQELTPRRKKG